MYKEFEGVSSSLSDTWTFPLGFSLNGEEFSEFSEFREPTEA